MTHAIDYEHGITAIDAGYNRPGQVAIHLLVAGRPDSERPGLEVWLDNKKGTG